MKKTWVVLLAACALASCKKEVEELPPPTTNGAGTFGARVNGELWVPAGFGVVPTAPLLEANLLAGKNLVINARNFSKEPLETEFEIFVYNVTGPGTYKLNTTTNKYPNQSSSYAYYIERKFRPLNEYITSTQYSGEVVITSFDKTKRTVSGTFSFQGKTMEAPEQTITVTDGRFDVVTP